MVVLEVCVYSSSLSRSSLILFNVPSIPAGNKISEVFAESGV